MLLIKHVIISLDNVKYPYKNLKGRGNLQTQVHYAMCDC